MYQMSTRILDPTASISAQSGPPGLSGSPLSNSTVQPTTCKLTLYSLTHFRGESRNLMANLRDFDDINFDDKIASVKIVGNCCWKLYIDANFMQGTGFTNLIPGEYPSSTDIQAVFKKASSAEIIPC